MMRNDHLPQRRAEQRMVVGDQDRQHLRRPPPARPKFAGQRPLATVDEPLGSSTYARFTCLPAELLVIFVAAVEDKACLYRRKISLPGRFPATAQVENRTELPSPGS